MSGLMQLVFLALDGKVSTKEAAEPTTQIMED
jgi:hypothetical protein